MDTVRWGVLGTGKIARTWANDLQFASNNRLVAVGSRDQATAQHFASTWNVERAYGSYEELVADPNVDAVYVATPHPFHLANATLALEAGKPVLVEKSFTMTGAEARQLVATARATGLFAMEAMWSRFLPHMVTLREWIAQGRLGDIRQVEADHGKWFPDDPASRLFAPELGGSAMLDLGVYPVNFAHMILGTPTRRLALVDPAFTGVDQTCSYLTAYPSGAHGMVSCSSGFRGPTRAAVSGTLARVEIAGDFYAPSTLTLIPRDGERSSFAAEVPGRGLHYQVEEVARCLREGRLESSVMPLDESIAIMDEMEWVMNQMSPSQAHDASAVSSLA